MTLPTIDQARSWRGLTLIATDNEPVGKIEAIYVDRTTRQPEWALVNTGLFGSSRTFVPLADAAQLGDTVKVPHDTSVVREAPRLEEGGSSVVASPAAAVPAPVEALSPVGRPLRDSSPVVC